mmetsp:Transcript_12373/g.37748  ORF Transcript_12373/g.37748 Transcript_12373/m.37748 type:complete len:189 (-) Transcript_12373:136-702(-)
MGNGASQSYVRAKFPLVRADTQANTTKNRSKVEPQIRLLSILLDGLIDDLEGAAGSQNDVEILREMRYELACTGKIREDLRLQLNRDLMSYIESAATRALERNDYGAGKSFSTETTSFASEFTNSSAERSESRSENMRRLSVSFCGEVKVREFSNAIQQDTDSLNRSFLRKKVGSVSKSLRRKSFARD